MPSVEELEMLDRLRIYLDITWTDSDTDSKLSMILSQAMARLNSYAGVELNYTAKDEELLLLDCCRYIWNNASEDFEINFMPDLIMIRAKYAVEEAQQSESQAADGSTTS